MLAQPWFVFLVFPRTLLTPRQAELFWFLSGNCFYLCWLIMWSFFRCLILKYSACPSCAGVLGDLPIFRTWPEPSPRALLHLRLSSGHQPWRHPPSLKGFFICSWALYAHHVLVPLLTVCHRNTRAKTRVTIWLSVPHRPQRLLLGLACTSCTCHPRFFLVSCSILTNCVFL